MRCPRAWAILIAVTVFGFAADLATKRLAFDHVASVPVRLDRETITEAPPAALHTLLPPHQPVMVVPYMLEFQLVLNPGAVFGIGPGQRWLFVGFTAIAAAFGLGVFARWTTAKQHGLHAAIGLVLAGGLGNLYDRIVFGVVRDFLHPLPNVHMPFGLAWPGGATEVWPWVSNVADALLLAGIAILLIGLWRTGATEDRRSRDESAADAGEGGSGASD